MMRKLASIITFALFAVPLFAASETFTNVSVVDVNCSAKVAADPDSHPRSCALKCEKSGYGILTTDKKFLKFDAEGNSKVVAELKSSQKKDHLRVDVTGDVEGDTLKVKSIKLL